MSLKNCWRGLLVAVAAILVASCTATGNQVQGALGSAAQPQEIAAPSTTALAPSDAPSAAANAVTTQTGGVAEVAAIAPTGTLVFLPVEGTPQGKASTLSSSLEDAASRHGITLLPSTKVNAADYRVKGYFSALNDGNGTMLVYIWDVLDPSGRRVHRINGQERTGSRNIDPWFAIGDVEIAKVADTTAARLKSWVASR